MPIYQASNSDPALNLFVNGVYYGSPHVPVTATPANGTDKSLILIEPDGVHSDEMWNATIDRANSRILAGSAARYDLTASGVGSSAQVGSGPRASNLSGLGGLIRAYDLQQGNINHALALAVPPASLEQGWIWPADGEDGGAREAGYAGAIHMGQYIAIPKGVDLSSMGLSPVGRLIAQALQNYGAYVVDSGGSVALYAEPSLESQISPARADMVKLLNVMQCESAVPTLAPYKAAVLADHPLTYYRLDDSSGTKMASQLGSYADGTYSGSPAFGQPGALGLGLDTNTAVTFDGNDGATIPVNPQRNFSIELWVKSTETAGSTPAQWWTGEALVDGDANSVAQDYGTSLVAGHFVLHLGDPLHNAEVTVVSNKLINDGYWHQVVATRDSRSGALNVYVDGMPDASGSGPVDWRSAVKGLSLGVLRSGPGDFFKGSLDEVAVYNQVLSAGSVLRHYVAAVPPIE